MDVAGAKAELDWVVSTANATPLVARQVCRLMLRVARKLIVSADISTELPLPVFAGASASLKDALVAHNRACDEAHLLYRRLAKGEMPDDVVMETYRSWFSYQDMPISLTVCKSMARPAGWSKLRAQVCAGRIYRKGEVNHE